MGKRKQDSANSSAAKAMDLRLIPEFDGASQSVSEWLEKTELVCDLQGVTELQNVVPLRLSGGAFCVYQQLTVEEKQSYQAIKKTLLAAFAVDRFQAYDQFVDRKLQRGEAVDVYLADLRRLSTLFGGVSEAALCCAFVAGLPQSTRQAMQAGARIEQMTLPQLLDRARALLVDGGSDTAAAVAAGPDGRRAHGRKSQQTATVICYKCGQANHMARNCRSKTGDRDRAPGARNIQCFRCHRRGHVASSCPENERGEADTAPVSSPGPQ